MIVGDTYDVMTFEPFNLSFEQKNKFKGYLSSKYDASLQEFQIMIDEALSESTQSDYLKNCTRFGLDTLFQTELEKRMDGPYAKIRHEQHSNKIVDYLMEGTQTHRNDDRLPKIFDILLLPGLAKELLAKLNHSQMTQSLCLNIPRYEASLHRLLQLSACDFIAVLIKLEHKDLFTLLSAKNNNVTLMDKVLACVDLKDAFTTYIRSQAGIHKLLCIDQTTTSHQQAGTLPLAQFGVLAVPQDAQLKQARVNLANALLSAPKKLTPGEVQLLTNHRETDMAMAIIAKSKGIEKSDLYRSVMPGEVSAGSVPKYGPRN
jgi:hypothetical protein